jgi:hypothetical protein
MRWNTASEPLNGAAETSPGSKSGIPNAKFGLKPPEGAAEYWRSNTRLVTRREKNSTAPSGACQIFEAHKTQGWKPWAILGRP